MINKPLKDGSTSLANREMQMKNTMGGWECSSMVENLLSMHKDMGLIPSAAKQNKNNKQNTSHSSETSVRCSDTYPYSQLLGRWKHCED
jgi:phage terminase small subunit